MRRIVKVALAATVLTSSVAATSVMPAAATDYNPPASAPCVSTTGAKVCFEAYGDRIWLKDTLADGHHARGQYFLNGGIGGTCYNFRGAGFWEVCSFAPYIPEHDRVEIQAARLEYTRILNASERKWVRTT